MTTPTPLLRPILTASRLGNAVDPLLEQEITHNQHYFATVEKSPLTAEQCMATAVMADRMLLVAAAGSGKTSVMVAKVGYALLTGQQQADQILVLAFNNKAAQELDERIHTRLRHLIPAGQRVKTKTFHALGLEIITVVQGARPTVARTTTTPALADGTSLTALIKHCLNNDSNFAEEWLLFRLFYSHELCNPASIKTRRQRRDFVQKNGSGQGRTLGFLSLNGEMLTSQCELAVANWLYMQGVTYVYRCVPKRLNLRCWQQHTVSGFFLTLCQRWILVPVRPDQHNDAWLTTPLDNGLRLSYDNMVSGRLFSILRTALSAWGQCLQPRTANHMMDCLGGDMTPDEVEFLSGFIHHARSNALNPDQLRARALSHVQADRAGVLAGFLAGLLKAHARQLALSDQLDFQEMINRASGYVQDGRYSHPYTLLLVDEFQDTSQSSAVLIKTMLQQSATCKLFAVGDDWQSIYRFAGADTRLFTHFQDYFGQAEIHFLSTSFRFNQGIADVATHFVQHNPNQIKKQVNARATAALDNVVIVRYRDHQEMTLACTNCLDDIQLVANGPRAVSVYILGRYRHQQPTQLAQWQARYAGLHLTFKTMHAAKGLEADYVLVLGLHGGHYAFPSQMESDPLLQLVMPKAEAWPDAEERRLLYVAMTRARHKVYLIASAVAPSRFVTELARYPRVLDTGSIT